VLLQVPRGELIDRDAVLVETAAEVTTREPGVASEVPKELTTARVTEPAVDRWIFVNWKLVPSPLGNQRQ